MSIILPPHGIRPFCLIAITRIVVSRLVHALTSWSVLSSAWGCNHQLKRMKERLMQTLQTTGMRALSWKGMCADSNCASAAASSRLLRKMHRCFFSTGKKEGCQSTESKALRLPPATPDYRWERNAADDRLPVGRHA